LTPVRQECFLFVQARLQKAIEYLSDKDKVYRAELLLGVSTDTQDSYGEVIREQEVKASVEDIER